MRPRGPWEIRGRSSLRHRPLHNPMNRHPRQAGLPGNRPHRPAESMQPQHLDLDLDHVPNHAAKTSAAVPPASAWCPNLSQTLYQRN